MLHSFIPNKASLSTIKKLIPDTINFFVPDKASFSTIDKSSTFAVNMSIDDINTRFNKVDLFANISYFVLMKRTYIYIVLTPYNQKV